MMLIHLSLVNVYLTLLTRHFRDTEMNRNNVEILRLCERYSVLSALQKGAPVGGGIAERCPVGLSSLHQNTGWGPAGFLGFSHSCPQRATFVSGTDWTSGLEGGVLMV